VVKMLRLDDLNLFYEVHASPERVQKVYDLLAQSPLVDTVYYEPKPALP